MIRPIRKVLTSGQRLPLHQYAIGKLCKVRTSRVDEAFGEAELEYEGAGLVVKVRTNTDSKLSKGDMALVIGFNKDTNTFDVVRDTNSAQNVNSEQENS